MDRGEKILDWIKARVSEGRTVYASTHMVSIKIAKRHVDGGLVRARNGHCEVQRGKRWESINFCKITAR